ncbi:hypothetical protein [Ornithinibacillus xuwenensis]|uniref:Uncharacterized protein n=1 Tax=Ornithinibacillus xuwenensis TaxID=3144668 RepID=A0ABU9XIE2_9BACI
MSTGDISLIGGLVLSGLAIMFNVIMNYFNKRYELKKEITLKVMELSYQEYENRTEKAIQEATKERRMAALYPYDYYLIHFARLSRLIHKKKLTEKEIKEVVQSQNMFIRVYKKEIEESENY